MMTEDNLKDAFAGESQANRKYIAFAKKAEEEGFPNMAKLFRAIAEAETVHALNHLEIMDEVKSTKENVNAAANGENYEHTQMYPKFIEEAKAEGNADAEKSFDYANQVEKIHEDYYKEAAKSLDEGKDIETEEITVCPVCGNTFKGDAPDPCPICGTPKQKFVKID
jgi:rubrerythrin